MNRVAVTRALSLTCYLGLIAFGMAWAIALGGLPRDRVSTTLLWMTAPLLLPLRGILHGRERSLVWGTLAALIPLLHGGVIGWSGPAGRSAWGWLEFALAVGYIVSASLFVRWRRAGR